MNRLGVIQCRIKDHGDCRVLYVLLVMICGGGEGQLRQTEKIGRENRRPLSLSLSLSFLTLYTAVFSSHFTNHGTTTRSH